MSKVFGAIGFFIYLLIGLYLLNYPFNFITMPGFIISIENWILFIGGILVIVGGIKFLLSPRHEGIHV